MLSENSSVCGHVDGGCDACGDGDVDICGDSDVCGDVCGSGSHDAAGGRRGEDMLVLVDADINALHVWWHDVIGVV